MTKKLLPPKRAERLLWLLVHFSVRMLSRYLDPWSRYGADVLIEYVDSLWHPPRGNNSRKVIDPRSGTSASGDPRSGERHSQ